MDVITFPENRQTTSGLQILLHGVISLPDTTSYDKQFYQILKHLFMKMKQNFIGQLFPFNHNVIRPTPVNVCHNPWPVQRFRQNLVY